MDVFLYVALKLFVAVFFFALARVISGVVLRFVPSGRFRRLLLRPVGSYGRGGRASGGSGKL